MREILFKAKRIFDGQWVIGDLSQHKTGKKFIKSGSATHSFEVVPETICQFTGLLDKKGNKIWENDIIRELDGGMDDIPRKVCWDEIGMMFKCPLVRSHWAYGNNDCDLWLMQSKNIEVISNIFDNPELLGGSE